MHSGEILLMYATSRHDESNQVQYEQTAGAHTLTHDLVSSEYSCVFAPQMVEFDPLTGRRQDTQRFEGNAPKKKPPKLGTDCRRDTWAAAEAAS